MKLLVLLNCVLGLSWQVHAFATMDDILITLSKRLPTQNISRPLDVKLGFYLESIGNFRSTEMSFDVDMYAYMSWTDFRLKHNFSDFVLVNDDNIRQQLWLPDLYFANAIQAKVHEVTVPNFNMFIAPDGTVAYSCRFTMQISCNLQLKNYPMDVQKCGIKILSYAYIAKQVNVTWFDTSPIRYNPDIGLPEFDITNVSASYCNGTYRYAVMPDRHKVDDFSCLLGNIYLARSIGYNLVQSYIPTGLIVMISWVSFWIDRRAVPARVTLSFTTLVSLTTLGNGLRFGLPQVSYAKAIDLWYGACMLFVFCALLEFAIINSYMRKSEKYETMAKKFIQQRREVCYGVAKKGKASQEAPSSVPLDCNKLNGFVNATKKTPTTFQNGDDGNRGKSLSPQRLDGNIKGFINPMSYEPVNQDDDERATRRRNKQIPRSPINILNKSTPSERIKFVDDDYQMAVLNGKDSAERYKYLCSLQTTSLIDPNSLSSYDNLSPARETFKKDDLDISDDDQDLWNKSIQRSKSFMVYATDRGTALFYSTDKDKGKDTVSEERYPVAMCHNAYSDMSKNFSRTALKIDKMCRYGFPLAFVLWNTFYWWYYLVLQKSREYSLMHETP